MNVSISRRARLALAPLLFACPFIAHACATCGCTLSSDWETLGLSSGSGWLMDLRYDYLDQNQLRSGTSPISAPAASRIVNQGSPQEVERFTRNQYATVGLDYSPSYDWGVNIQAPFIDRSHSTLGVASDGSTAGAGGGQYDSKTSSLGDVRIIGRYQGLSDRHNVGFLLGLKLPTGRYDDTGTSTDPTNPAPAAIDRGLQPGTGTTDVLAGVYYLSELGEHVDFYSQALVQVAMDSRASYRPGDAENVSLGIRYLGFEGLTPQVQLNARHSARDSGVEADTVSTGGTLLYLSPGVTVPVSKKTSLYAFMQMPLYQDVRGVQLAPRYTATLGARISF